MNEDDEQQLLTDIRHVTWLLRAAIDRLDGMIHSITTIQKYEEDKT